ncbi:hypothetical protein D3C78_930510 [compost metagenome]
MGKGPDFAGGTAGRGLAGERERAVTRFADLAGEQMDVVDQVVGPDPTGMLVKAHGPERHHFALGVGIQLGQGLEALSRHPGLLCGTLQGVRPDKGGELVKIDVAPGIGFVGVLGPGLEWIVRAQAVADVVGALGKAGVLADEVFVDRAAFDDVIGDVVEDQQIGLWLEHHGNVGQFEAAVLEGR